MYKGLYFFKVNYRMYKWGMFRFLSFIKVSYSTELIFITVLNKSCVNK